MNVLQINLSDYTSTGGTGIAMRRLHGGLKAGGHQSKIFCLLPELGGPETIYFDRSLPVKVIERALLAIENELGLNNCARIFSTINIRNRACYKEASVLQLHCIHGAFISYLGLPWLTAKPTIYTMHDMWGFTGHCHYSYDCDRWKTGCGKCPYPDVPGVIKRDNTSIEWKMKNWAYNHSNLHIVTNSTWMTKMVKQSMLNHLPIHHIPYGLDTEVFQPLDKEQCRSQLGIPKGKKVLMFGAATIKDSRKGGDLLLKALETLPASLKAETVIITMGSGKSLPDSVDIPAFNFGFVNEDSFKAVLYSAADLFIFPTRNEAFGIVSTESMACGTPVVAFNVGGVPDAVRPGITGLLAERENVEELRDHIVQLLEDDALRLSMSSKCRAIAVEEYSLELYTQRYINLYHQVIEERAQSSDTSRLKADLYKSSI